MDDIPANDLAASCSAARDAGVKLEHPQDAFDDVRADGHAYCGIDLRGVGRGWAVLRVPPVGAPLEAMYDALVREDLPTEGDAMAVAAKLGGFAAADAHVILFI
jgi:hypothetical protein